MTTLTTAEETKAASAPRRLPYVRAALALGLAFAFGLGTGAGLGGVRRDPASGAALAAQNEALDQIGFRLAVLERRAGRSVLADPSSGRQERDAMVAMLAIHEIRERTDSGMNYAAPMAMLRTAADRLDPDGRLVGALSRHAERGVASPRELEARYGDLRRLLDEQADHEAGSLFAQVSGRVNGMLARLYLAEPPEPGPIRRAAGRIAVALQEGELGAARRAAEELDGVAREIVDPWLAQLVSRIEVQTAVETLRQRARQILDSSKAP